MSQGVLLDEREKRGLTKAQMAQVLGIDGPHAEQIVTDFETGFRPVKGPTLRIYEGLNRARWSTCELLEVSRWTISVDRARIHHNEWPRFVAQAIEEELHPQQWRFKKAGMPVFAMDTISGYRQLVYSMIDHIPDDYDAEDLFTEALRELELTLIGPRNV